MLGESVVSGSENICLGPEMRTDESGSGNVVVLDTVRDPLLPFITTVAVSAFDCDLSRDLVWLTVAVPLIGVTVLDLEAVPDLEVVPKKVIDSESSAVLLLERLVDSDLSVLRDLDPDLDREPG